MQEKPERTLGRPSYLLGKDDRQGLPQDYRQLENVPQDQMDQRPIHPRKFGTHPSVQSHLCLSP
jgi:hypothetical protein